jgi:hypothetical protein
MHAVLLGKETVPLGHRSHNVAGDKSWSNMPDAHSNELQLAVELNGTKVPGVQGTQTGLWAVALKMLV